MSYLRNSVFHCLLLFFFYLDAGKHRIKQSSYGIGLPKDNTGLSMYYYALSVQGVNNNCTYFSVLLQAYKVNGEEQKRKGIFKLSIRIF
jgi:hypothetical protein